MTTPTPHAPNRLRAAARNAVAITTAAALALGLSALTPSAALAAAPTTTIADVQGDGAATPVAGAAVTVEGVVTGDYRAATASGYRGFYLQTAGSGGATDATPGRSDAVFVFAANANPAVAIGDLVTVTGTVSEFNGQTQISATTDAAYELVTPAVGVPAPTVLPNSVTGTAREALEGMLVTPESARLSSSHQLFNFGSLWLNVGELAVKATETTDAGPDAQAIAAANRANRLLVDDGYSVQISNAAHPGGQPYFDAATVVRNGDRFVAPAAGMILGWGFDDWRLQPQRPLSDASPAEYAAYEPTWESLNPRTAAPAAVGGDVTAASFNVFNYFTTFGGDARGADNAAAFAVQQSKIVAAINALDADMVGLMEIENSVRLGEAPDEALGNLVAALNAASAPGTWAFVPTPTALLDAATTDFITNAIIYKPAAVTPVGDSFADTDETVWDIAREPIAQTFETVGSGKVVTLVANHFKSKSPPSGNTAPEPADLQGFFNAERVEQATKLVTFVNGVKADPAKGENVLLVGDFNAYAQEDPAQVLTAAGLVDLVPAKDPTEYTYTFDGELGSLDHAFATPELAASVTGVDVWNINSPEWGDRGYEFAAAEPGTPYRSSDHDPIVIGLDSAPAPVDIDILSINDFHGRLEAAPPVAGAAVLAGMVDAFRAANPNTVFVGAGDLIGASTFTSFIQNDEPTIDALNEMGLAASALGNHEFDLGRDDVDDRILPRADWDYLAANIYDRATNEPAYDEYYLQEFGEVTVGFVGAMTEELPSLVSPSGIETLEVREVVPEVNRVADELSDGDAANGEADVIVLLVHEGAATTDIASATDDSAFGRIVTGSNANIDAIVSAHTHLAYDHEIPITGTTTLRPVIASGQYGERFGHMDLSVDPATGAIISLTAEVLPLAGAFAPDPEVAQIVADAVAVANVKGAVSVGEITADFNRAKQSAATFAENRGGESTLGNFVADVQLWATTDAGADIALMNPGGLRADLDYSSSGASDPDGNVTYKEAAGVQPFANTLVTLDLTAAQLKAVLEEQWQPAGASRPFLKLGVSESLEYTYDPAAPAGDHIDAIYVNGELVEAGDSFTVTVNSFLASGGDNFSTLAQGTNRADSGKIDLQSMVDYFEANPVVSPDYAQRAVGATVTPAGPYAPGDQVTLALSSLLFSNGEPNAGDVVVSSGGVQLATAPIDPTIVDATDEVGRATVTVTIPADAASGTLPLTVTVPQTGTSIEVPIEVEVVETPIENVTAPTITGNARVGSTLTASGGTWSADDVTLAYQWNRAGAPIQGATASTYKLTAADAGAAITVTVTATAEGSLPGSATSDPVTVAKIASSTSGQADRLIVFGNAPVNYTVTVKASGASPTGDVAIYDGLKQIATVTLDADDAGKATVQLPRLGRGLHLITASYGGNEQVRGSLSWPSLVLVF
jgi:5'-nucleotidase